ncbi:ABC transporter permease [Halocatena halophila]|uniref:ABC transporter permease n=1 Tax=Halocatena halophila TaxID=2814576 RepID=UPI002ED269AB
MSTFTVARDDFRNVRRSYVIAGTIGVFSVLVGLVFLAEIDIYSDAYRTIFDVSALVAFILPLFIASMTYLSVAGAVDTGTIQYVLGLPNSRAAYLAGTFLSRAVIGVATVVVGVTVGFIIAAVTFENGADAGRFLWFLGVSMVYALSLTGLFVGISAMTNRRSRAMMGVFIAYFVLVGFWGGVLPVLSLQTLIDAVASTLGVTVSETTREFVAGLSPVNAYFGSTRVIYSGVFESYPAIEAIAPAGDDLIDQWWYYVLIQLAWTVVVPMVGYLRFKRAELT